MSTKTIPSMGGSKIAPFLYETARSLDGVGSVVECGSWLGASTEPVLRGLRDAGAGVEVHCYDQWNATPSESEKARGAGVDVDPGDDLQPLFLENVGSIYPNLVTHRTGLLSVDWTGEPIELYIDDANKRPALFGHAIRTFGPGFVPEKTVLVLMDYQYYQEFSGRDRQSLRCQRDFIESHPDAFREIADFDGVAGVAFEYLGGVDFRSVELDWESRWGEIVQTGRRGARLARNGKLNPFLRFARSLAGSLYFGRIRPLKNQVYCVTDAAGITGPRHVYRDGYYRKRTRDPHLSDSRAVAEAIHGEFLPTSVIDLGCAVGHYLLPFHERGVDVHGVDGHPAAIEHAVIPRAALELADLRDPYDPPQRFDVALCIEVAEHLAPCYAETLVRSITAAAAAVVFTAAPPGQGGTHHVNEQPRGYWKDLFADQGFGYDDETTGRLRGSIDLSKLTHVTDNLFVFEEGQP